ncbi:TonB-dependent receptor plug domain-containing protein [Sphingomonas sp. Sphisp140]|uniref:TonB-dependent receptor plug domain-containing protein n=1 Tax=unclassified Sphingomonas TaxID=196159 RepID=UPI0039AFB6F2
MNVSRLLGGAAIAVLATTLAAGTAQAQDSAAPADASTTEEQRANEILVTGQIFFRNRTADPNPILSYDLEYFQKFEPISVGEMLKRVPGATFTSDVLEYDQVQFRGLPGGFTNVLINGRRAPGGEADGTFFVDRIPAELVERIEIVRAPRPDQPSDGVAGTLNVVTKESTSFKGGFGKIGALLNTRDGVFRPSAAAAFAGRLSESTDYWIALNYQKRRNPKSKVSYRFDDVPVTDDKRFPGDPAKSNYVTDPEFHDFEAQSDTRDGSDLSGSAEITTRFGDGGRLRLNGFFVDTHRDEDEQSVTLEDADLDFDGVELQKERIKQQTYAVTADAKLPVSDSFELGLAGGWNQYRENTRTSVFEGDNENDFSDVDLDEEETLHIKDTEFSGTLSGSYDGGAFKLKIGSDFLFKTRDGLNDGVLTDIFRIRENRYSPYVRLTYDLGSSLTIDGGARYEIADRKVTATTTSGGFNNGILNPSLSVRWSPTSADQFRASVARTIRRPDYDLLSPIEYDETPGDDDTTTGNPDLRNQSAWGVDIGYERRIGGSGIAGVNFFYRDITDLIELVATRDNGAGQDFRPQNIGDGQAWGVEFDLSAPLTFLGMPDTGVFANYTYLDSSTTDPFTGEKRRFNAQPHHVYNVGFIQTVKAADVSFGATISGRSKSLESNFDETVELRYDPDLEAFVEKRIGKHIVLRVSAQNLLDRVKYEEFRKYDGDSLEEILQNRAAGDLDEYEIEREHSGPLVQFTIRAAF